MAASFLQVGQLSTKVASSKDLKNFDYAERVLAIGTPLRLELYERSARSGLRVDWRAPYHMASGTVTSMVQPAEKLRQTVLISSGMG